MKHIGILKPERLVSLINNVGLPLIILYVFSMLIYPWFDGKYNWKYVQDVWDRWQSLNVGMLAFISSLIAFNMTRYNSERQREREFQAAKAFLPDALTELTFYLESCADVLKEAWERNDGEGNINRGPLVAVFPDLPHKYRDIFSRCIERADSDVGDYLSKILIRLQISHSRIKEVDGFFNDETYIHPLRSTILTYIFGIGEIKAIINNIYGYARNIEEFKGNYPELEDIHNAYRNMDIHIDEYEGLDEFTQRRRNSILSGNSTLGW